MIAFWNALSSVTKGNNNRWSLPKGVYWMGNKRNTENIYIRKCYRDILQLILEGINSESNFNGFIITGNPGIGNTVLFNFLIFI
jgi:hypothetical protein